MQKSKWLSGAILLGASTVAGAFDGSAPLICAATSAAVCDEGADCVQGSAKTVNLPLFWRLDFANKVAESAGDAGNKRRSKIVTVTADADRLVVQGSEKGFGWNMSIDQATGNMVMTGGRVAGYVVFGGCTAL